MSRQAKDLVRKELIRRLQGVSSLAVVSLAGVDSVTNGEIRHRLLEKDIRLMVVKNALASQAFASTDLEGLAAASALLDGPCALAFGADSVVEIVRELLDIQGGTPQLTLKGALMEGERFGPEQMVELSRYPTRDEAIARIAGCILSPGGGVVSAATGPGRRVAALVKAIEDRRSDEGADEAPVAA